MCMGSGLCCGWLECIAILSMVDVVYLAFMQKLLSPSAVLCLYGIYGMFGIWSVWYVGVLSYVVKFYCC